MNRLSRKFAYTYRWFLRMFGVPRWRLPVVLPDKVDLYSEVPELRRLYMTILDHTLVDKDRVMMLWQFAEGVKNVPGDVAEIGVYKGGTARLLAAVFAPLAKNVYLFDTFEGMPETRPDKDWHRQGDFQDTSLEAVKSLFSGLKNVEFRQGYFPHTAKGLEEQKFSFVHCDADIYQSVWDSCEFFYPRLSPGGVMIFDDYGFKTCPGAKEAVDKFFKEKSERPIYLPTLQAFVIKR